MRCQLFTQLNKDMVLANGVSVSRDTNTAGNAIGPDYLLYVLGINTNMHAMAAINKIETFWETVLASQWSAECKKNVFPGGLNSAAKYAYATLFSFISLEAQCTDTVGCDIADNVVEAFLMTPFFTYIFSKISRTPRIPRGPRTPVWETLFYL